MSIYDEDDRFEYEREHERIFGHRPLPDATGKHQCIHPIHDRMQRMIEAPGVNLIVQFPYQEMISDDDDIVLDAHKEYDKEVDHWRDEIQRVEAEEKRKETGKTQW